MLLRTEHLTKDYGARRALDDFNLSVESGEIVGLLGPNGSGKSTALRLILGFLRPSAGCAMVAGHDCWRRGVDARRHVAYLPGELRLYENMSGRQLLTFLSRLRGNQPQSPDDLAERFDIDLDRPIKQLSSGMKRKLALMQVLLPRAPLLVLDEPTNTLDPSMREELLAHLRQARTENQGVLFSSHVLGEVESTADRAVILREGKLVYSARLSELPQGRRMHVRFSAPSSIPGLAGVTVEEEGKLHLTLEVTGPLNPLLEWLGRQQVADLRVEELGLWAVYRRYHGNAS